MVMCTYNSVVLVTLCLVCVCGFNLEPRIPVIKQGDIGSYFGYSVAEHLIVTASGQRTPVLLVGAPLGQNLQPETNHSGALWRCPLTSYRNDCEQVITDGKRDPITKLYNDELTGRDELMPPVHDVEIKDGQWMGVTVRSQGIGKNVMVCAHRYINKEPESHWGQGLCYILTQELDYSEYLEPCKGRPVNRAHEEFGYCQAGTNGQLLDGDMALLGTPGPYTWRGTVFATNISEDWIDRDKTQYMGPVMEGESPVDKYSYLGMSVASGRFFGNTVSYVAGAPRANGTGQVVFFNKVSVGEELLHVQLVLSGNNFASSYGYEIASADINSDGISDLIVGAPFYYDPGVGGAIYVYMSPETGLTEHSTYDLKTGAEDSRFGFAICNLGDLNKDGFEDVAVGAPYEGKGVVYIYLGGADGLSEKPMQVLKSESLPGNSPPTFGYSLSGGLDLDRNGYPDLLIGAYSADQVILIRSRPIVGIETKVESSELQSIDPSGRGCQSDPGSNEVCFSFQTCFKMHSFTNSGHVLRLKYYIEAETFEGRKRFSRVYFAKVSDLGPNHVIEKQISLNPGYMERFQCSNETVYVKDNTQDIQSPILFKLSYSIVQKEPRNIDGYRIPDVNNYPILDQQEASKVFQAKFKKECGDNEICESNVHVIAKLALPISDDGLPEWSLGKFDEVVMNVGVTNNGESAYEANLYVHHPYGLSYIGLGKEVSEFSCNPYNSSLVRCSLGNPLKRTVEEKNMELRFGAKEIEDIGGIMEFVVFANTTSNETHLQEIMKLRARARKRAELQIDGTTSTDQIFYGGKVIGESAMIYQEDIGTPVQHQYVIYNAGPWRATNIRVTIWWPFQVENQKPQGKWLLYMTEDPYVEDDAGVCILTSNFVNPLNLPSKDADKVAASRYNLNSVPPPPPPEPASYTEPTLIVGEIEDVDVEGYSEEEDSTDNIYVKKHKVTSHKKVVSSSSWEYSKKKYESKSRTKRDREMIVKSEAVRDKDGKIRNVVYLNCKKENSAKCFEFYCNINNLKEGHSSTITINARLWNSTLVEDYPNVNRVEISSHAHLESDVEQNINADDRSSAVTKAYPDLLDQAARREVPIWIIIVSVLAGILLLAIIVFICWKCGFFKRKRPTDPTLSGNLEKHREVNGDAT